MSSPFTLRFILAGELPTAADLAPAFEGAWAVDREEDGVLHVREGEALRARLDLLRADTARGKATLEAVRRKVKAARTAEGAPDAREAVLFMLESATGIVLAKPELTEHGDIEDAMMPLDAVWEILFEHFGGLLQIDGEGIFGEEGPLLVEG